MLARLAAILPRDPDRMAAFLWETGVVNDPGLDLAVRLNAGQRDLAYLGRNDLIGPRRLGHEVKQRLMLWRCSRRCGQRRHGLDAFRSPGNSRPVQSSCRGTTRSAWPITLARSSM